MPLVPTLLGLLSACSGKDTATATTLTGTTLTVGTGTTTGTGTATDTTAGTGTSPTTGTGSTTGTTTPPVDLDGDGWSPEEGDCDDADPGVHPGAVEDLGDGVDQDCDGVADDAGVAHLLPGDLVITEILANPAAVGDGEGEWIEVHNARAEVVDLEGVVLRDEGGDAYTFPAGVFLDPGALALIGALDDPAANGGVDLDHAWSGFFLSNTDDEVVLEALAGVVDRVDYASATWPVAAGASMQLHAGALDAAANDDAGNWCLSSLPFGDGDAGTPGLPNEDCPQFADADGDGYTGDVDCDDGDPLVHPGATEQWYDGVDQDCSGGSDYDADGDGYDFDRFGGTDCDDLDPAIHPGAKDPPGDGIDQDCSGADGPGSVLAVDDLGPGDLVITEIMQNPAAVADDAGEYFEVYNASGASVDLDGLQVTDLGSDAFTVAGSVVVPAGGYVVFGRLADPTLNGGVPVDVEVGGAITLANGDDEVVLANGSGVIDQVAYDGGTDFPDPSGASMNLDAAALDAVLNDDGANWCPSTTPFGDGDAGTPGAPNEAC